MIFEGDGNGGIVGHPGHMPDCLGDLTPLGGGVSRRCPDCESLARYGCWERPGPERFPERLRRHARRHSVGRYRIHRKRRRGRPPRSGSERGAQRRFAPAGTCTSPAHSMPTIPHSAASATMSSGLSCRKVTVHRPGSEDRHAIVSSAEGLTADSNGLRDIALDLLDDVFAKPLALVADGSGDMRREENVRQFVESGIGAGNLRRVTSMIASMRPFRSSSIRSS